MAKYISQKTLLLRLKELGIKISRQTLHNYRVSNIFVPDRYMSYGNSSFPLYKEGDEIKLKNLIVRRYKNCLTRDKKIFINSLPSRN